MDTQPILPEEHSLDDFIDKLEELCDCKGMGWIQALESIVRLKKENERLERLRITFINRYGELKKIVCPDSQFQDHKSIREGCLKLQKENEKVKERKDEAMRLMEASDKENDELKKENKKMKAFLGELKINVVKKD